MKIKELRIAAGLTQMQLAEKMEVSQSTIVGWEQNSFYPPAKKLPVLAKALGVSINDLYKEESA